MCRLIIQKIKIENWGGFVKIQFFPYLVGNMASETTSRFLMRKLNFLKILLIPDFDLLDSQSTNYHVPI